jgi:hypothetical protein
MGDMPKENVVSFRLDETKFKALTDRLGEDKPVGVKSENQLARKIVNDVLAGRLTYTDPNDRFTDLEALGA